MKSHWLFMVTISLLLGSCGKKETAERAEFLEEAERVIPVRAVPVAYEQLVAPVIISGTVAASNEARPAFKTGGVISRILAEEGDLVREGQLLATLNLTEINAQVLQAEEAVKKAKRDLERVKNLYADSVATLEQVQDATTGLTVGEQNLEMARFNRSYSEIRAPFSGKIIKKLMNEGEVAGPGTPVFYMLSNAREDWVVKAGLADRDWARLSLGDKAEIRLDAYPGQTFQARVSQLADVGNPASGTFDAEFTLTGPTPRLAVGLIASIQVFPGNGKEHTVVPIEALVESNGSSAVVYTLEPDQTVRRKAVTIGFLHEDKAIIVAGLEDIDSIITTGAPYLEDGRKVTVIQ